ncbi:hypothetical protein EDD11_004736 [Mortierella claussenii]|nr:hypothetical protein EDD11_004736 [Mortierella claussenii]
MDPRAITFKDKFAFPDTRLVCVGSRITQVTTFISSDAELEEESGSEDGDGDIDNQANTLYLQLSEKAQELLQKLIWATVVNPPQGSKTFLEHDEFLLTIKRKPWKLPQKYDILLEGQEMEPTPFKLWFRLRLLLRS